MNNGSTWKIWDLHVHTPHSALNNQFGDPDSEATWENYVSRLEAATQDYGVVAIGVTDYFTIEGYTRLLQYKAQGRLQETFLFPNIEFRLDTVVYRENDAPSPKRLNLHVLFSPSIPPSEIQEHFLDDLEFVHEQEPFQAADKRKLKRSNLTSFGASLQEQHESFRGRSSFEIGCLNAVVSADKVKERLDARFRGRHLLVLAEETLPLLHWDSQHHGMRKHLMQMSHAVFSSNEKTCAFCLGLLHPSVSAFVEEFKSLKPCLWGSDTHAFDERFLFPDLGRFCWIKSDITWEGLRQVIFEPAERVSIQETCPEPTKSIFTVKRIEVSETAVRPSLTMAETNLSVNPNLVAIIGSRGSGKTALLDLLASCFPEGHKLRSIPTSFVYRLFIEEPPAGEADSRAIPITVSFASGETFTKEVDTDPTCLDSADVAYLTQNHFDEYSADPDKLNRHIIELVFEHFIEERRKLQDIVRNLQDIDRRIQDLNLQLEQLSLLVEQRKEPELAEQKALLGTKEDIKKQIAEIEASQGKQAAEAKDLSHDLDTLLSRDLATASATNLLKEYKVRLVAFLEDYAVSTPAVNAALRKASEGIQEGRITLLPMELTQLDQLRQIIDSDLLGLSAESSDIAVRLLTTRQRIAELQGLDKLLAERNEVLSSTSIQLEDVKRRIAETSLNEEKVASLISARTQAFADAMALTVEYRAFLQSIIEKFREASPTALENISFNAVIDLKGYAQYVEHLATKLDNRVISEADLARVLKPVYEVLRSHLEDPSDTGQFLTDSQALWSSLETLKTKSSVTICDYGNAAFRRFFKVGISLMYAGKRMIDLSMGERAIILLKVLLALGEYPLLIDQPEEHLDNRFVFDDLVPAFREAKTRRQILIATHNANLVVNTDAEQIVIADNSAGVISYTTGTLEDLTIRDAIKAILEGGDEAFKKRELRYGYMF